MPNKIIVTTTINKPTEATLAFASMTDWHLVVVGDSNTPHRYYRGLKNTTYLSPENQEELSRKLSDAIGWRSIQRRNMGFLKAYQMGADIMATVDDDNIPYEDWGVDIYVGQEVEVDLFEDPLGIFDPLSVTDHKDLWHRGFPIQYVSKRNPVSAGRKKIRCMVQADLWNGDPDIDAICRITKQPNTDFSDIKPFASKNISPFNSQNTFIHRDIIPHYMVIPHIGRMDDIWGSYVVQEDLKNVHESFIVYNKATVFQNRNSHDLTINMEDEMIGYKQSVQLVKKGYKRVLPEKSMHALDIYRRCF